MLQSRKKWHIVRENVKVGDILLVIDENMPRGCWPLGLVLKVNTGRDGMVRSVKLRSRGKEIVRPISKLVFVEGHSE